MSSLYKIVILALSLWIVSCVENKASESNLKSLASNVSTRAVGVGVNEDIAIMDSYSSYYALKEGVRFTFEDGKVKLKLDFKNVPVDTLTGSRVTRPWNGFVVYDYPYEGNLAIRSANIRKISASISLTKPFSFLSKMLAKALLEEYAGEKGKRTGTLYFTSLDYRINEGDSVDIRAEIILAEDISRGKASGGK